MRGFVAMAGTPAEAIFSTMTYALDIDVRIERLCLHAGRLHAGA